MDYEMKWKCAAIILAIVLLIIGAIVFSGCASVKVHKELPDGTYIGVDYVRWWNQSLEGLRIRTPEGYEIFLDKQKSDFEAGFNLGMMSVKMGGDGE
jgi:hypothetical protein